MFGFDLPIFRFFFGLTGHHGWLDGIFIFVGEWFAYILGAVFIFYLFSRKGFKKRLWFFSSAVIPTIISRGIIAALMHFFIVSPRPFAALNLQPLFSHSVSNSFPSGHMSFFIPLGLALFYENKKAGLVFLFFTVLMGIGRVVGGVHWPSDILTGVVVGAISFYAIRRALRRFSAT
jgi:membrane-associated phospholipid phosphatase